MTSMEVEHQFGVYGVLIRPGSNAELVVALASRNGKPPDVRYEWRSTLRPLQRDAHLIFVKDTAHSWYNSDDGWRELLGFIRGYRLAAKIQRTVALGLSMGGFGAFLMDAELHFDRVVTFAPQTRIGPEGEYDFRFSPFWNCFEPLTRRVLSGTTRADGDYVICASLDDALDVEHAALLARTDPAVKVHLFHGDHNFHSVYGRLGIMGDVIQQVLDGDAVIGKLGAICLTPEIEAVATAVREGRRNDAMSIVLQDPATIIPVAPPDLYPEIWSACLGGGDTPHLAHSNLTLLQPALSRVLGRGWFEAETWGHWAQGDEHEIAFTLVDSDQWPSVTVELTLIALVSERHPTQRIVVRCEGETSQTIAFQHPYTREQRVTLSVTRPDIRIMIHSLDAVSPLTLGVSEDDRKLSVGVWQIQMTPGISL